MLTVELYQVKQKRQQIPARMRSTYRWKVKSGKTTIAISSTFYTTKDGAKKGFGRFVESMKGQIVYDYST